MIQYVMFVFDGIEPLIHEGLIVVSVIACVKGIPFDEMIKSRVNKFVS